MLIFLLGQFLLPATFVICVPAPMWPVFIFGTGFLASLAFRT